jgi:hypothetical protein
MVEEHITTGQANCVDDVSITLRYRTGKGIDYSFNDPDTGHGSLTH